MPRYTVNATIEMAAWITVDAWSPDAALAEAHSVDPSAFEYDTGTASVEFNVTPAVEPA